MMRHYLQETSEKMQRQIDKKLKMAPQLKKGDSQKIGKSRNQE